MHLWEIPTFSSMKHVLSLNRSSRNTLLQLVGAYSIEQLNHIPPGFSNNLAWNLGHIIVTQQGLVYGLSGLPTLVSKELIDRYKKGTRPEGFIGEDEIREMKRLLFATLDQTERDYAEGRFVHFTEFPIATVGHVLQNIDDALLFNDYHEGIHLGMMLHLRKFI